MVSSLCTKDTIDQAYSSFAWQFLRTTPIIHRLWRFWLKCSILWLIHKAIFHYPNNLPHGDLIKIIFFTCFIISRTSSNVSYWMDWLINIVHTRRPIDCMYRKRGEKGVWKWLFKGQHASTWHRYRTDRTVFGKLAQQSAQLSITESYLFDHFPENNLIKFSKLSEAEYGKKRYLIDTIQHHDSLIYIQSL